VPWPRSPTSRGVADPKNWEAAGFNDEVIKKMTEKAREVASEPFDDGDRAYDRWKDRD
jgi:hypothetical protein